MKEQSISVYEVYATTNEIESRKAPGLDGFLVECSNKVGVALLEWLVRLFNISFDIGVVPT